MRTKPQTKKRRNTRWQPQKTLNLPIPSLEALELPSDDSTREDTYPEKPLVNSGMRYESSLTRELKISANDVPIAPGSWLTDYDGIAHSINKLTSAAINARNRLEWAGNTIRMLEVALHQKEGAIAKLEGREAIHALPEAPFFDPQTNPEMVVVSKSVVNRALMGLIGVVSGAFFLYCVGVLLFE